ncbi:hypothetical protein BJV82DRAFT_668164 [Fennellomyces sp. T-0311]|nr:hypothetical protein BJV82DRAFT_668164 [Fennellomyces sp. T-0311]
MAYRLRGDQLRVFLIGFSGHDPWLYLRSSDLYSLITLNPRHLLSLLRDSAIPLVLPTMIAKRDISGILLKEQTILQNIVLTNMAHHLDFVIVEYECANMGNNYPTCAPTPSDTWYQGSEYKFIWNSKFPYFITEAPLDQNQLDLHLYYRENYAYRHITSWSNLPLLTGSLSVTVNNSWFPSPAQEGTNQTWTLYAWFLPSGKNATHELVDTYSMFPRPFNWTVVQFYDPNYTNENNGNGGDRSGSNSSSNDGGGGLPGWAIAVITIACVAFVAAIGALIAVWYMRRRQKQNQRQPMTMTEAAAIAAARHRDPSAPTVPGTMKSDGASIYSNTPIVAAAGTTSRDSATTDGSTSTRPRGSPPADTFRNLMFSEWKSRMPDSSSGTDEDELRRRRLGEALLQRELEEEGAAVKHTDRRPMTVAPPEALESKAVVLERQDGNHPSPPQ